MTPARAYVDWKRSEGTADWPRRVCVREIMGDPRSHRGVPDTRTRPTR